MTVLRLIAQGLSGTVGATLDPIMSLQREVELQPGETVQLAFLTLAADSRAKLLDIAGRYQSLPAIEHAIGQARSRAELELRQSSLSTVDLERIQTLLSALLYPQPGLRAAPATLAARVALDADQTGLSAQLDTLCRQPEPLPPFAPEWPIVAEDEKAIPRRHPCQSSAVQG